MLQFFSQLRVLENIVNIFIGESTTRELQEKLWHKVARRTKIGIRVKYKIISIFIFFHAQLKKRVSKFCFNVQPDVWKWL